MFHEEQKSEGVMLSSKMSFILGFVASALVLCSIGFVILLFMVLGGSIGA